jgi:hypothetical protein
MSGLIAAVAAALYGLVLWGRGTASGPLVDATTQRAARLAKLARQAKVYEAALAELADTVQAQPSLTTEKPEGATPCEPPSSAV